MDSIHVTFPDGKSVDVRPGAKIDELARQLRGLEKLLLLPKLTAIR